MADKNLKIKSGVSTIAGGPLMDVIRAFSKNKIDSPFFVRVWSSLLFCIFAQPFRLWEHLRYDGKINRFKIKKDPVFILGHWRSGTTFLHNLICQDPQMGYVTTYQGVFPELLFGSKWIFKTFMGVMMPKKRASDNVELDTSFPQEEEFAIGNMSQYSYYHYWFFPKKTREYYLKNVEFQEQPANAKEHWKKDYIRLVKKALINTSRTCFVSKNPPHTGRVKLLLETFPNAKFIHIYRNPITVFISTMKLIKTTLPALQFQHINEEEIEENVLWIYKRIITKYLNEKTLIKPENLVEIKYEEFEQAPLDELEKIYSQLNISGFNEALPSLKKYIDSQKDYTKNKHKIARKLVDRIQEEWKFTMDLWDYSIPDNVEIIEE